MQPVECCLADTPQGILLARHTAELALRQPSPTTPAPRAKPSDEARPAGTCPSSPARYTDAGASGGGKRKAASMPFLNTPAARVRRPSCLLAAVPSLAHSHVPACLPCEPGLLTCLLCCLLTGALLPATQFPPCSPASWPRPAPPAVWTQALLKGGLFLRGTATAFRSLT